MKELKKSRDYFLVFMWLASLLLIARVYTQDGQNPDVAALAQLDQVPPIRMEDICEGTLVQLTGDGDFLKILPQLRTEVHISITGMVATATVDQVFSNSSTEAIEAIYVFPLPNNAAVYDMKMLINDRFIQGEIKERQDARRVYEAARSAGKRASLSEQERPNIFTNSVANIMPGDKILVRLQYVETLVYNEGRFQLRFPLVVGPRFIPGNAIVGYSGNGWAFDTDLVDDASRITPPVLPQGKRTGNTVSLTVELNAGLPLDDIQSLYHPVNVTQPSADNYLIEMSKKDVIPNKDYVLEYRIREDRLPQAALFSARQDGYPYFMLMAVPPMDASLEQVLPREMTFVLDISGSMSGTSIKQAKAGLSHALTRLRPSDHFNIIAFNDSFIKFSKQSLRASEENLDQGAEFIERLSAQGGTHAYSALEEAFRSCGIEDLLSMVIFLTDGCVGNETRIISLVKAKIANSRLFSVGIGSAPNSHLLEKVSQFGRGCFTYIGSQTEVTTRMDELFAQIENPVLTDIRLIFQGEVEFYPNPVRDLFHGEPLLIAGRIDQLSGESVELTGRTSAGIYRLNLPLKLDEAPRESAIPTLWARRKVSRLMDDFRLGAPELKPEIVQFAIKHHLLTKFTSFVAVEHKIVNPDGNPFLAAIPTEIPDGWVFEKVFGENSPLKTMEMPRTASGAPLRGLIGLLLIGVALIVLSLFYRKNPMPDSGSLPGKL